MGKFDQAGLQLYGLCLPLYFLLAAPALRNILEVDSQACIGRIDTNVKPRLEGRVKFFKLDDCSRVCCLMALRPERGVDCFGEDLPDILSKEFLALLLENDFCYTIDIGKAPVSIQGDKSIADALQDSNKLCIKREFCLV
jgi:hypothetical protein